MAYQERAVCGTVLFTQLGTGPHAILQTVKEKYLNLDFYTSYGPFFSLGAA